MTDLEALYLTDGAVQAARSKIVGDKTFPISYYDPSSYETTRESGTSHMIAVDSTGMAISLTSTINAPWGSEISMLRSP